MIIQRAQKPHCTVIIPAYNEASVIEHTLKNLLGNRHLSAYFEVIVSCNGCDDETAVIARRAAPEALVLESETASKTEAMNRAIERARSNWIVFLDADIETSPVAVFRLVSALQTSGAALAHGQAQYDIDNCSFLVRQFFAAWQLSPYFDDKKVGGFFAVSREGTQRIAPFPKVINDDEWVRRQLIDDAIYVPDAAYRIRMPLTLRALIGVRARVYRGNDQLDLNGMATERTESAKFTLIKRLIFSPSHWLAMVVFIYVGLKAQRLKARQKTGWNQDKSARQAMAMPNEGSWS